MKVQLHFVAALLDHGDNLAQRLYACGAREQAFDKKHALPLVPLHHVHLEPYPELALWCPPEDIAFKLEVDSIVFPSRRQRQRNLRIHREEYPHHATARGPFSSSVAN